MSTAQLVVWVYIALLMLGGLMGFVKAGSKASLIASGIFSAVLALFALNLLPFNYTWIIFLVLVLFFGKRFLKSKKVMPSGMMALISLVALVLFWVLLRP